MSDKKPSPQDTLQQWLNGDLSNAEAKEKLSDQEFTKYQQILSEVDNWKPSLEESPFDVTEVTSIEKEGKQRFLGGWQLLSVAASFLLILFAGYFFIKNDNLNYETAYGETLEIILPDGHSKVVLGPNSKLTCNNNWSGRRQVELSGKAFFQVEPGSPFSVLTKNGNVDVLGTSFDVNTYDESMHVVCYEGLVRATGTNKKSVLLKKGESSRITKNEWEAKVLIKDLIPSWLQNEVKFDNAPLEQVIQELQKWYGLTIERGNVNLQRRFTGSIPTNDANLAVQILFNTLGIQYNLEGNQLTLSE